jgi:hypothetical protein
MMAQSNRKQVEALSEISNIIVKLSDEDLERMESLAEQITPYDPELGDRILDAYALLTQLNVELALERLEPDTEDMEEEDIEAVKAEANETDAKVGEDSGEEQEKGRLKRQK